MRKNALGVIRDLMRATIIAGIALVLQSAWSPAGAESVAQRDHARDVRVFHTPDGGGSLDPHQSNGDLHSYTVTYTKGTVEVTEHYRNLALDGGRLLLGGTFKLANGKTPQVAIRADRSHRQGSARLHGRPGCEVNHRINYKDATLRIQLAPACLHSPAWLRFQPAVVWIRHDAGGRRVFSADIAPGSGLRGTNFGVKIHQG